MNTQFPNNMGGGSTSRCSTTPLRLTASLTVVTASIWTWILIMDIWTDVTPLWTEAAFWLLIVALPLVAGLTINRWFSVFVSPVGMATGFVIATVLNSGEPVWPGELPQALIVLAWSGMMLIPWSVGHVIIGTLTARRKPPEDY